MNLTKKIWHDENSEPPKNYLWAKGGKLFKNIEGQWKEVSKKESEDEESGSGSISMYDAWMKTYKGLEHQDCPVKPKKVARGWLGSHVQYGTTDDTINLNFCNATTNTLYTEDGATIYDIENVPDDIYNTEEYCFATFLYDLDELNQYENIQYPIQTISESGFPYLIQYGSTLSKFNTNVISIDGKYYVWFQDWD